jgi:hypothetical protein
LGELGRQQTPWLRDSSSGGPEAFRT